MFKLEIVGVTDPKLNANRLGIVQIPEAMRTRIGFFETSQQQGRGSPPPSYEESSFPITVKEISLSWY